MIQQFPDQNIRKDLIRGPPPICILLVIGLRRQTPPRRAGGLGSSKRGRAEKQRRLRVSRRGPGGVRVRGGQGVSAVAPTLS